MEIFEKIEFINSLDLDKRIDKWEDIILMAKRFLNSENQDENIGYKLLDCIRGVRTSRFIDTEIDLKLLDACISIARKSTKYPKLLKELLNDALYYSNYYPEKYSKIEIEEEVKQLERLH